MRLLIQLVVCVLLMVHYFLARLVVSVLQLYLRLNVTPSVCPHGTTRLSLDGFS